jgi:RNA polymerase sigma-70 factor (ECF subfamily)
VTPDDGPLVERCLKGDAAAMRGLIERFQPEVFGLCVRLLGHRQDAEDVSQEVFLRVFRSLRRWDGERPLRPWVLGIAVNRCRTAIAQRPRRPELADYLHEVAGRERPDDAAELRREIRAGLADLRPDYRAVFVMFHEQGLSYDEVALALERPVGTIKTWLHRARTEMLDRLRRRGMVPVDDPATDCPARPRGKP